MRDEAVEINPELLVRGRATAAEEGLSWQDYVNRALRLQIERDNATRAVDTARRKPDPGE
ncbi:MAG: hypothetical protein ABWY93_04770 [Mycobacterium sp.]